MSEPFESESAAVQAWIDGEGLHCKCGALIGRTDGRWHHLDSWAAPCESPGPNIAEPLDRGDVPEGAVAYYYREERWVSSVEADEIRRSEGPKVLEDVLTCGTCGHRWAYGTPASRCPKEYDHEEAAEEPPIRMGEMTDEQAMERIAYLLRAEEWPGASGMEDIAEIVAWTGRDLTPDPSVDWPRH